MQEEFPQQLDVEQPEAVRQILRENDLPEANTEEDPQGELPALRPGKLLCCIHHCKPRQLLALRISVFSEDEAKGSFPNMTVFCADVEVNGDIAEESAATTSSLNRDAHHEAQRGEVSVAVKLIVSDCIQAEGKVVKVVMHLRDIEPEAADTPMGNLLLASLNWKAIKDSRYEPKQCLCCLHACLGGFVLGPLWIMKVLKTVRRWQ